MKPIFGSNIEYWEIYKLFPDWEQLKCKKVGGNSPKSTKMIKNHFIIKTAILYLNLCKNVSKFGSPSQKRVKKDMSKIVANITSGSSVTAAN